MHPHVPQPPSSSEVALEDGRRLALHDIVGSGAASTVYRASLASPYGVRRIVAAKVFGMIASDDSEHVLASLALAAQRGASVRHPNVVGTYDFVVCGSQPLVLAELVDGVPLEVLAGCYAQDGRRIPLDLALFILSEVCAGLAGARTASDDDGIQLGLLHLGLTPREVLLSWHGEVKVEGFGLETARAGSSSVRSLRAVAGRATTLAPEVAAGEPGDARADVFSLGVMMRELLVGPRFPRGITHAEAIRLAREGYVQPLCFQPHLPDALAGVMVRAMEADPGLRYPNASAMAYELRRIVLAMGASDGRYFLARALDRQLRCGDSEITAERDLRELPG
jgi:eukaryotic-like serine/threonine-protein kinase